MAKVDSKVVLDLHGARAIQGVDIDALETFLEHFRAALREFYRAGQAGAISRKGGRPHAKDAAASAFRLVRFRTGSGIAELAPSLPRPDDELALADTGEELSMTTLRQLMAAVHEERPLPDPVWEELSSARRAMGEDGSFGVRLRQEQRRKLLIDEARLQRLKPSDVQSVDSPVRIIGRLHMIEADPPNRRVGVRAQDGVDWTCSYPDRLHPLVTQLVERLVRLDGIGRRMSAATGRCQVEDLEAIPEYSQDALFSDDPPSVARLQADQGIDRPQGLESLVGADWNDEEADDRFLEAVLSDVTPPR
jgi:hypothetical protein